MATHRRMKRWGAAFVVTTFVLFCVSAFPALAKSTGTRTKSSAPIPFAGQIQNVGTGKANGILQLSGKVRGVSLDLSAATLWLTDLLREGRGAGELARDGGPDAKLLPLSLTARKGSTATSATFESAAAGGDGPQIKVTVAQSDTDPNEYDFTIKVERALIPAAQLCGNSASGTTELRTRFVLRDGLRRVRFQTRQNWQCTRNQLGNPSPADRVSAGLGASGTAEELVISMAKDLTLDIASDLIVSALFPSDSIDYQQLIDDFAQVVQQELDAEKIETDENSINGFLQSLNDWESAYDNGNGTKSAQLTLAESAGQLNAINGFVEQLKGDGQAGLSGWIAGAQTNLNYLQFEQALSYVANPSDLSYNKLLANHLDYYLQYLVAQRGAILHQGIVGSLHYCYDYHTNCSNSSNNPTCYAFKNCTGATHDGFYYRSSCEINALNTEITGCAVPTFNEQTNEIAWIDTVIAQWRTALANMATGTTPDGRPLLPAEASPCATCQDANAAITVNQATDHMLTTIRDDGGDSDTTPPIDTTVWAKAACDSNQTCDYQIQSPNFVQSAGEVHAVSVSYHCGSDTTQHTASLADVGSPAPGLYDGAYLHLDCAPRIANYQVSVQNKAVGPLDVDASTDGQRPNAGKITNGKFVDNGHSAADSAVSIVLPHNMAYGALTIDLGLDPNGHLWNICGNGYDCASEPEIQADNDDTYELDYSTDGVHWSYYGQFPHADCCGLQARTFKCNTRPDLSHSCSATNHGPNFQARYVRVWGVSGGNTYAVSQLQLWNTGSQIISIGKPAWGPEPFITNGQYANPGESWDNSLYVTKLSTVGPAGALLIDLGAVQGTLDRVKVQAHGNGAYQVDVSTDGAAWFNWYSVPPTANAGGLQTRDSGPMPPAAGRFARIYATHGNDFSVSEVQLFADQAAPTCNGTRACGVSAATLLEDFAGATPQDVTVKWTCASDPTPYMANAVPWTVTRSGVSYPDSAVVQARCRPTTVTCTDASLNPTTCSNFAKDAADAVVYANAAKIPFQLSATYSSCSSVISTNTNNYYKQGSTANNPACQNVQSAIHDAIAAGSCPAAVGSDANNSWKLWPYNFGIGAGTTATPVVDPAVGQPPLLLFLGCNSLLQ